MVFIKTNLDDVALNLDVDTMSTTLSGLKEQIGKKWIIQTMLQKLYLGVDYNLEFEEIIANPSMQLRDDLYQGGDKLSISQLGVKPWSTLLLVGPVFRPTSFFESDDAVVVACRRQLKRGMEMIMEQDYNLLMMNNKKPRRG